jgi:hypothetical protein
MAIDISIQSSGVLLFSSEVVCENSVMAIANGLRLRWAVAASGSFSNHSLAI